MNKTSREENNYMYVLLAEEKAGIEQRIKNTDYYNKDYRKRLEDGEYRVVRLKERLIVVNTLLGKYLYKEEEKKNKAKKK